jgi:PII-like signaling protein
MLKFTIIAGLNDKDSKKQEISTESAYKIIFETLKNNGVEGATLTEATGFYTHNNGETVIEKSIKIELLFIDKITAVKIAKNLRIALNQESVVLEVTELESELIEG